MTSSAAAMVASISWFPCAVEMNTVSKVFLRDFYETLAGYRFYRLDSRRLIPLGGYQPRNEIFQFQNVLAVHSALHPTEEWT